MILLSFVSLALAHKPLFVRNDDSVVLQNEPSAAIYASGNTDVFILYDANDTMHTSVLIPYTHGYYGEEIKKPNVSHNCSSNGSMENGAPHVDEVFDEPFAMGSYIYSHVIFWGETHPGGICRITIESESPYVVSIGREEEMAWISIPNTIMSVSAWNNNYVYGWVFLIGLSFLIMATIVFGKSWEYVVVWTLTTTMLNRLLQLEPFGWVRPNTGILFILFQLFAGALVFGTRRFPICCSVFLLFLIVLPFFTWVDQVVLLVLIVIRVIPEPILQRKNDDYTPIKSMENTTF